MAIPPADFVLHNSLFLIAHFHNVAIGGVVFGVMAGYTYWFPKAFGFKLNERLGKAIFWCWFIGFYLAFMPLYALGLMGATRRMQHYPNTHWQPLMLVALAGAVVILIGIALTVVQLAVSIRERRANRDETGDPWNGRTLEWSMPSPPPAWNFTVLPSVEQTDAYWEMKKEGVSSPRTARLVRGLALAAQYSRRNLHRVLCGDSGICADLANRLACRRGSYRRGRGGLAGVLEDRAGEDRAGGGGRSIRTCAWRAAPPAPPVIDARARSTEPLPLEFNHERW